MPELEGQPTAPATTPESPAEAPATPVFDPEAFKASLLTEWETKTNERISGVQSSFQKLLNEKEAEIRELKTASLSEEEREQLEDQEAQEYLSDLEFQVWLARDASTKYAKAAPHIQKLYETKGDLAAFAEYLESALSPAPATPEPEPAETVPDVDPNSPAPAINTPRAAVLPDGRVMTKELADQLLRSFGDTPISTLRGG